MTPEMTEEVANTPAGNQTQQAPTTSSESQEQVQTAASTEASTEQLQNRIAELEKEASDLRDNWLRAAADYKNFKRRVDQDRADLIRNASASLLLKLLPVIDDIDRALESVPPDIASTPWFEGMKLISQKLATLLESEGVTQIEALGQDFDPNLHEAVIYEEGGDDHKVIAELRKGYKLRDRVLRPTMVKVGKA